IKDVDRGTRGGVPFPLRLNGQPQTQGGDMAVKLAVIYYSSTGTTYRLAQAVAEGAEGAGAEVRLRKVKELAPEQAIASNEGWSQHVQETQDVQEATLDDLTWADAIVLDRKSTRLNS